MAGTCSAPTGANLDLEEVKVHILRRMPSDGDRLERAELQDVLSIARG